MFRKSPEIFERLNEFEIVYKKKKGNYHHILSGYVDSNWGGDEKKKTDRKSTTGFIFKLFERCTINWNTKGKHRQQLRQLKLNI